MPHAIKRQKRDAKLLRTAARSMRASAKGQGSRASTARRVTLLAWFPSPNGRKGDEEAMPVLKQPTQSRNAILGDMYEVQRDRDYAWRVGVRKFDKQQRELGFARIVEGGYEVTGMELESQLFGTAFAAKRAATDHARKTAREQRRRLVPHDDGARAKLSQAQRRQLPASDFALPRSKASRIYRRAHDKGVNGYPMDTRARARAARSYAVKELNAGRLEPSDVRLIFQRTTARYGFHTRKLVCASGKARTGRCKTEIVTGGQR